MAPIGSFLHRKRVASAVLLAGLFLSFCRVSSLAESPNQAPSREGFLPVTGGKIWYRLRGGDKAKPALIALHGGPGASHLCFEFLDALADERPVVIYDQLGCGQSDHPDNLSLWTMERAVDELDQVIGGLGFRKVFILGHSWGSMMAFEYMVRKQPKNVAGLILAGPCMSASRWLKDGQTNVATLPERLQRAVQQAEATKQFASAEYQEAMDVYYHRYLCRADPWPDCLKTAIQNVNTTIYTYMWGPSEFTATGTLKGYERAEHLKEIKVPTLFTCGEFDEALPSTTRYYASLVPGAKVAVFKGAGHCHLFEQPAEYVSVLRAFLGKAERTRLMEPH